MIPEKIPADLQSILNYVDALQERIVGGKFNDLTSYEKQEIFSSLDDVIFTLAETLIEMKKAWNIKS